MADLPMKSGKKRKRNLTNPKEKQKLPKARCFDGSKEPEGVEEGELEGTIEVGRPWRNLQLILFIQDEKIDLQKKVDLAFDYVNLRAKGCGDEFDEDCETVKVSSLVVFLNDWLQSLLKSTDKKNKDKRNKGKKNMDDEATSSGVIGAGLDYRWWVIFKFCLEESLRFRVSLIFRNKLLEALCSVAKSAFSLLTKAPFHSEMLSFTGKEFELYRVVVDCVSLLFSSHGGLSNENLDRWISTVDAVLQLVHKVFDDNLENGNIGIFALQFSCLVLEPFTKFLKVHPTQQNRFRNFVDKLLETLLHLSAVLHHRFDGNNSGLIGNLRIMVEEVLSQGLFHPTNIDGFLSLRSAEKYVASIDGKMKDSKMVNISYHRHLFDKLESTIVEKKESVLSGLGQLFHLFVDRVKKHKVASMLSEESKMAGVAGGSRHLSNHKSKTLCQSNSAPSEISYSPSNLNAEKRRSLFDFFVQIMEPLLLEMNGYLQSKLELGPMLLGVHCTLSSINSLLAGFLDEKLYIKTEDISQGASLNFLKNVYAIILSFATNLLCLPTYDTDNGTQKILILLSRNLLVAIGYFLDLDYEVIENDLTSLWLILLSYLAFGHFFKDEPDQYSLTSQVLALGCQLVKLYSELRQVESAIFAFCKAVRLVISNNNDDCKLHYGCFWSHSAFLPYEAYKESIRILLSAQQFKLAIYEGIKSLPEGQVSDCIRQLSVDLSESIEWIKKSCAMVDGKEFEESQASSHSMLCFDLQAELFGRGLSETYAVVLGSLTVTTGNSSLLGRSIQELMTVIRPYMSILVTLQPDGVNDFLYSIMGFDKRLCGNKHDMLKFLPTQWVFVFFFRLYMSSRSLFRQAISMMPPGISIKMSAAMGDSFTAYSGMDWMDKTDWTNQDYFSCIVHPSASLLDVIQSVSGIYLQGHIADCSSLVFILNAMALQRLVDLNRQIKSLEYVLQSNDYVIQTKMHGDSGLSLYHKGSKKWEKHIHVMKQEAAGLTEFMMSFLSLLDDDEISFCALDDATCLDNFNKGLNRSDNWVLSVCSLNKKSLLTAYWWIVCQNIDIWSIHAKKKKLKMFLSHVICTSLPFITRSFAKLEKDHTNKADPPTRVTVSQISLEVLTDSILYEYKFVRRQLASRFCHLLQKSVLSLFSDLLVMDVDLNSSPNWKEVLSSLESSSMVFSGRKPVTYDNVSDELPADIYWESTAMKFTACHGLLQFLCWMPKGCMNSKSFSLYVTCLLNLERLQIDSLLKRCNVLSSHMHYELLRLLVTCRRALRYIIVAYCEEKTGITQLKPIPILLESSFSVLWLLKSASVVVEFQETVSEDCSYDIKEITFLLMDHTSYIFLTLSKYQCSHMVHSIVIDKLSNEQPGSGDAQVESSSNQSDPCLDTRKDIEAHRGVLLIAESLKEQTQVFAISFKNGLGNEKVNYVDTVNLNKLSFMVSCISGFLWGLASALNSRNETDGEHKMNRWKCKPLVKLNGCIVMCADFISSVLHILSDKDNRRAGNLYDSLRFSKTEDRSDSLDLVGSLFKGSSETDVLTDDQHQISGAETIHATSSVFGDDASNVSANEHSTRYEDMRSIASVLRKLDSYERQSLNNTFLQSLLNGDHPKTAILVRHLFIASAAVLRLNLQTRCTPLSRFIPSLFGISQFLLLEFADYDEVPQATRFVWLDGVVKYLEELGTRISSTNPTLTRNVYIKLIELHLKALGKCISLQGKGATLASHKTGSTTKMLHDLIESSGTSVAHNSYCLDELKARLRMSFKVLIRKPSELHLLSAIQSIERALVGVHDVHKVIYEINSGSVDGGKVSSTVAAGIDCLDMILEYVSGRRRDVLKRHIQSFIAALFNIILHLQSPLIFYCVSSRSSGDDGPDPGAVILMCVELLTRVSAKPGLFQMDSWHVGQSLRISGMLFQDFLHLKLSDDRVVSGPSLFPSSKDCNHMLGMDIYKKDRDEQFSTELFAACCRLLYTNVKYRNSETEQCIALLQESSSVLLHCLETVQTGSVTKKGHDFSVVDQEGVKCACFLRRIYEELKQQKDVFGRHCYKFLYNYIWVYSGYGPLKTGIRREIDEALRPGVYALIEVCCDKRDDLQYLHSVFGEGPCRNTLAMLQHDYKLNFQYEGKV